ncbi:hypothetical protein [Clostridium sp.]|uniref:hypothetical protein n=1 Tax=Clostridium sp. TaxID=1506 RepID=UPI003994ECEF
MSNNIVKQSQLKEIIDYSWTKTKERYDNAFVDAEIPATEKKITFRKANNTTKDVNLTDYARLQDKNNFKQDVSVNNAANINNTHIGTVNGAMSRDRFLAYRGLTSKSFIDGYVHSIIVYIDGSVQNDTASTWKVWAINKKQNKDSDTINTLLHTSYQGAVETLNIDGTDRKIVRIPVDRTFNEEVYFLLRTTTQNIQAMTQISSQYIEDVINVPHDQSSTPNENVNYNDNATNNTITMHLVGRESIKSLSEKLDKVNADGGLYVKKEEVSTTSVANKVVRLGADGKLDKGMLPSIAINDYFTVSTFNDVQLRTITYENGDIVVATDTSKRYLCINKGTSNATTEFIELNSKDGIITSINGYRPGADGNIVVTATQNGTGITMTFGSTGGTPVTVATYMTDQEVTEIKNLFV